MTAFQVGKSIFFDYPFVLKGFVLVDSNTSISFSLSSFMGISGGYDF
jgi:hypothetical protein